MEVFNPVISIVAYIFLIAISFAVAVKGLVSLYQNNQLDKVSKFLWTVWIVSIPILGALFYYIICKPTGQQTTP